jgi:hypothetical protein
LTTGTSYDEGQTISMSWYIMPEVSNTCDIIGLQAMENGSVVSWQYLGGGTDSCSAQSAGDSGSLTFTAPSGQGHFVFVWHPYFKEIPIVWSNGFLVQLSEEQIAVLFGKGFVMGIISTMPCAISNFPYGDVQQDIESFLKAPDVKTALYSIGSAIIEIAKAEIECIEDEGSWWDDLISFAKDVLQDLTFLKIIEEADEIYAIYQQLHEMWEDIEDARNDLHNDNWEQAGEKVGNCVGTMVNFLVNSTDFQQIYNHQLHQRSKFALPDQLPIFKN